MEGAKIKKGLMCYYVYAAECYELSLKFTFLLVEYCSANVYLNKEFRNELKVITMTMGENNGMVHWGQKMAEVMGFCLLMGRIYG